MALAYTGLAWSFPDVTISGLFTPSPSILQLQQRLYFYTLYILVAAFYVLGDCIFKLFIRYSYFLYVSHIFSYF
jgi:hypothetical protein